MALSVKKNEQGEDIFKRSHTGKRVDTTIVDAPMFGSPIEYRIRIISGQVLPDDVGPIVTAAIKANQWTETQSSYTWRVPGENITVYRLK